MLNRTLVSSVATLAILASFFNFPLINTSLAADFTHDVNSTDDVSDGTCDGVHCSFREALIASNNDGGTSEITFSVTGTITFAGGGLSVPADTTITGPGAGSLTMDQTASGALTFAGDGISISGLTLTDSSSVAILFSTRDNVTIQNLTVTNTASAAIYGIGGVDNALITGNTISGVAATFSAIQLGDATNSEVSSNNISDGAGGYGIIFSGTTSTGNLINANTIDTVVTGIFSSSTTHTGTTVSNNIISNTSSNALMLTNNFTGTVDGNTITSPTGVGLYGDFGDAAVITDNTVTDVVGVNSAYMFVDGNGLTITGNTANGNQEDNCFLLTVENSTISGNTMVNCPRGIMLYEAGGNGAGGNTISNNTLTDVGTGFSLISSNNTISDNSVSGATVGVYITLGAGTATDATGNEIINSDFSGASLAVFQDGIDADDINYIEDSTFSTYTVNDGTVDVTFNVNVRASHNDYNLEGVDITATQTATDVESVVGTTNALGYAATALNYQITNATAADLNLNEFQFVGVSATYGTSDGNDPLTLSAIELTPDVNDFDTPIFIGNYFTSYTPITVGGTDYNDRLVYTWALAGDGTTISDNGTPIAGATGTDDFEWSTVEITGGALSGENWTIITREDIFENQADLETWLDQHTEVGVGNYNITNEFISAGTNLVADGAELSYDFALPVGATVAPGGTNPGYLRYGNSDFFASATTLDVNGVEYADALMYVGTADHSGEEVTVDNQNIHVADGTNGFNFVLINVTGVSLDTLLFRDDNFPTTTEVISWLDATFGAGTYSVDYESVSDGSTDLVANGFTNNYSFRLPIFSGVTVTIADGETDPGYLTVGAGPEPVVTLTTSANTFGENGGSLTATATLAEVTDKDVTVNFSFGGTATNAFEYTRSAESVTIPAGETTNSITLTGINNATYAENKTVILGIDYAVNASSNTPQATTLTILNDDDAPSNSGGAIGKLHEEEEQEEPEEQEEQNSSVVPTETVETNETREATNTITNFISEAIESINEGSGTYETIDNALSDYREASTPQNVYLPESILKNLTGDPDGDGFTTAEEIYMGTDPNKFNEAPNFPSITNLDGKIVGDFPSFRLTSAAGDTVEVFLVNADNEEISLGLTTIDERNKGEIHASYPLPDGVYFAVPKGNDGYGAAVRFTVDAKKAIAAPQFYGPEFISVKDATLGEWNSMVAWVIKYWDTNYEEFDDVAFWAKQEKLNGNKFLIIKGSAAPNSTIYLTLKSVIYSSVVLSDASGNFEVRMYGSDIDFDNENHSVLGYAVNEDNTILSNVSSLLLTK